MDWIFDLDIRSSLIFSAAFDGAAIAAILVTAAFVPTLGSKCFSRGERVLRRLARHLSLAVSLSGL
jgi:hypothetical protein